MVDLGQSVNSYYTNLAIQFGYIAMFMCVFPAAITWGFLANLVMIILTEQSYSKIARRSLSKEIESIGVWNDIFLVFSFISTVVNAMIVTFTSKSVTRDYFDNNRFLTFLGVIAFEHFIIILKFLVSRIIPDIPKGVKKRRKNDQYLRRRAKEKEIARSRKKKVRGLMSRVKMSKDLKSLTKMVTANQPKIDGLPDVMKALNWDMEEVDKRIDDDEKFIEKFEEWNELDEVSEENFSSEELSDIDEKLELIMKNFQVKKNLLYSRRGKNKKPSLMDLVTKKMTKYFAEDRWST
jgi:hypothetical protein